jgi:cell division protein FtsZ
VQGISDIITIPGIINRDFADVKAIMAGMGYAVMGTASSSGSRRAIEAAQKAIASPLLEAGAIDGARGILINITGSASLKLAEVQEACSIIQNAADDDANIIFGAVLDEKMKDSVKITVIATGFKDSDRSHRPRQALDSFTREPQEYAEHEPEPEPSQTRVMSQFTGGTAGLNVVEASSRETTQEAIIGSFEPDDLDVPAFMRKRNETM